MSDNIPRFSLGQVVATPGAVEALRQCGQSAEYFLAQHLQGQWGNELCEEDRQLNEQALTNDDRLFSAYRTRAGAKIWIITEADRSTTCILLPEEY